MSGYLSQINFLIILPWLFSPCTGRLYVNCLNSITNDPQPLPSPGTTEEEEDAILHAYPWIERPINIDYGNNIKVGSNVFINFNCTFLDTCTVSIGARTLVGPNVCFFSGTHPLDPDLRNGTNGPELGREITVGEDCWIAGNVIILPGVTIGDGCTIGAGSVVTKVNISVYPRILFLNRDKLTFMLFLLYPGCPRMSRRGRKPC